MWQIFAPYSCCLVYVYFVGPRPILWSYWLLLFCILCVLPHGFQMRRCFVCNVCILKSRSLASKWMVTCANQLSISFSNELRVMLQQILTSSCFMQLTKLEAIQNVLNFRWFNFTLKPPYSIAHGNLWSAFWDTSFQIFFVKFGHRTP